MSESYVGTRACPGWGWILGLILSVGFGFGDGDRGAFAQGPTPGPVRWRALPATESGAGRAGFARLGPVETGIAFTNRLSEASGATNRVLWNGSGLAVGDVTGDGLPDIYLCRLEGTNALYKNLGGFRFADITAEAGLALPGRHDRGAVFADVNGDGPPDLLVATTGLGVRCFLNDGVGRFREVSRAVGTLSRYGAMTLALADVNGDAFLDLYVCTYRKDDIKDLGRVELPTVDGRRVVPPAYADWLVLREGRLLQYGEPDFLYLNDGKSGFRAVSWTSGNFLDPSGRPLEEAPKDWGLSAMFRDLNGDSFPDLYVCNDYWTPDRIFLGDGKGGFRMSDPLAFRKISGSSMGVDAADIDRDGDMDLLVVEMLGRDVAERKRQLMPTEPDPTPIGGIADRPQVLRNTLFRNRDDGTFAEVAHFAGIAASGWSWSPVFLDVDLDGYEDVLVAAGHVHDLLDADAREALRTRGIRSAGDVKARIENDRLHPPLPSPIVAFRNRGDGTFEDVTSRWGTDFPGVHHAIATADFDGDGDLDFAANGLGDAVYLYRNESTAPRVAVRLRGARPNGQGIGALVTLRAAGLPAQSQEVVSGGRYMAASDPLLVFATAGARGDMELDVRWRSGRHSLVRGVRPNRLYEIEETGDPKPRPPRAVDEAGSPLFRDVSDRLAHVHRGRESDDFGRQPLRHASPSRFGPGVAWLDLDGDDREDLVVGAGRGGRTGVWWNRPESGFVPADVPWGHAPARGDQVALAGWSGPPGMSRAWMAIAVSGGDDEGASAVEVTEIGGPGSPTVLAPSGAHPGPVAWGDLDGDGVPELFVGGGAIPGRYPLATPSHVFRRRSDGSWSEDPAWGAAGRDAGLVRAARWSDLDGDGSPDLVLACEWGPIRIFRNRGGRLEPWNPVVIAASDGSEPPARTEHLDALTGWWSGLAAGDFDEDGRLDLVVGNWGLNSAYRASPDRPLTFAFAAFRGSPEIDLIETEWDPLRGKRVPSRRMDELAPALPWLPARFPSHRAYAEASLVDVLGDLADTVGSVSATRLESLVLLNRGDSFRGVRLPDEAQWSPAFGISVADADGDGHEDVFLAQNFFGLRPELGRQDAGRGLWLAGDGKGGFRALSSRASGIRVDGEGRGSAVADFDGDGRPDLAVAQHGAETKLFANVGARPGLRVRLEGPPGNRRGVGSVLRFHRDGRGGPAREIAAGSGYGSQDGGIQVLGTGRAAGELRVVWPGGIARSVAVEAGASEITARFPGGD